MAEEPAKYSEEFFAARIETLQSQIKEALPTLETSEAMKAFHEDCQVQWACWMELMALKDLINKTGKGDEKNELQNQKKAKDQEYSNLMEETWPERMKTGAEFYSTLDLAALETVIMECTVLIHCEPKRLAEFIAESWKHKALWKQFVSDPAYMKRVLVSGGANNGLIHRALKLHQTLRSTIINDAPSEIRENLALAVALEFVVPQNVFKREDEFIDPMDRFWHFVNAFDRGDELDKHFETLTVWELRNVVDCNATNEELQWGRDYLKIYRPDQVRTPCPHSKYLWSGRTDVAGRGKLHEFENYKDVISAGGPCGPNAFWGRFIIKCHGLPAWGVRQPSHAAISRWYPDGCWGTELGMKFSLSHFSEFRWTPNPHERRGEDFNYDSRARINGSVDEYFANVTLLEGVSDCMGDYLLEYVPASQVWRNLAITQRRMLAERPWVDKPKSWNNKPMKHRGELLDTTPAKFETTETITWESGEAIIPASILSDPVNEKFEVYHEFKDADSPHFPGANYRTGNINIMASWTGGNQVCFGKGDYTWEYDIPDTIPEGTYGLSCKVSSVHRTQHTLAYTIVDLDGNEGEWKLIEIPYTVGYWERTGIVLVDLKPGSKLKFSRQNGKVSTREAGSQNLAIKEFYLKPKDQLDVDTEYVIVDN